MSTQSESPILVGARYFIPSWLWPKEVPTLTPYGAGWVGTITAVGDATTFRTRRLPSSAIAFQCDGEDTETQLQRHAFVSSCVEVQAEAHTSKGEQRAALSKDEICADESRDPLIGALIDIDWPGDRRIYRSKIVARRALLDSHERAYFEYRVEYYEPKLHSIWHDLREFDYELVTEDAGAGTVQSPAASPPLRAEEVDEVEDGVEAEVEVDEDEEDDGLIIMEPPLKQTKRMRRLRFIEWFAGSGRLSFALMSHGWDGIVHDLDADAVEWEEHGVEPSQSNFWQVDFMQIDRGTLLNKMPYDYFHFSVDCSSFSGLARGINRRMSENAYCGETHAAKTGNMMLARSLSMIEDQLERNPAFLFTLENPVGDMQKHPLVANRLELSRKDGGLGAVRCRLNYCLFSDASSIGGVFHKPTIFWTNCQAIVRMFGTDQSVPGAPPPQFVCSPRASPCGLKHRAVCGNTKEATPFPHKLAATLALLINVEASSSRQLSPT